MRSFGVAALLSLGLLSVGYDSQNALKSEAGDIGASLKTISNGVKDKLSHGQPISFQDPAIQAVVTRLKKLSSKLTATSTQLARGAQIATTANTSDPASTAALTNASATYLNDLSAIYQLYAFAAHGPGANASQFNFNELQSLNLKLDSSVAQDLVKQQPFNARHSAGDKNGDKNDDKIEFFITSQEKQMAEFFALTSPRDEYTYSKLIQFAALHEAYVNLWSLQRLTYSNIALQNVQNSSPDLLSFKNVPNGDPKQSEAYLELLALDRYTALSSELKTAFAATRGLTLLPRSEYYDVLSHVLGSTPEFKAYISGVTPQDVSKWVNGAAAQILTTESANWTGDEKNSENILGSSSLLGDDLTSEETAKRMAEIMFDRRAEAAEAEILKIAADNIKVADLSSVQVRADVLLKSNKPAWTAQATSLLLAGLAQNQQASKSTTEVTTRIQQKTVESLEQALSAMNAVHDRTLIQSSFGVKMDNEQDANQAASLGGLVQYLRPQFQFQISDPETLQSHLLTQAQKGKVWAALDADNDARTALTKFFADLTTDFTKKEFAVTESQARAILFLSIAQADANATLNSLGTKPSAHDHLKAVFDQIALLSAKVPTDLSPKTSQQLDLANLVIENLYDKNPLLGVRTPGASSTKTWTASLLHSQNPTALERLYKEASNSPDLRLTDSITKSVNDSIDADVGKTIIYQSIQAAASDFQGKLEDFSQADLHNPKDLRFRNLFLSSSHLRTALMSNGDQNHNALVKKFDASLIGKTESMTQEFVNKVVNPANNWLFGALIAWTIIAFFCPIAIPASLATFFLILNMTVFPVLTAAQLFLSLNISFIEQPAQLRFQEALASSQISSQDPFSQWEDQKNKGAFANTIDRNTVDEAHHAMVKSQIINTSVQVANAVWIGHSTVTIAKSNIGRAGEQKLSAIFGEDLPPFAARLKTPTTASFGETLSNKGLVAAAKQQASSAAEQTKVLLGVKPVYGLYTSSQALDGLKSALARQLSRNASENTTNLLPEIQLYREFLKARLKTATAASSLDAAVDVTKVGGADLPKEISVDEETPDPSVVNGSWTAAPELKGPLSFSEMIENPDLRKWMMIPKSAFAALREHRFPEWRANYGTLVQSINQLRGEFVQSKLATLQSIESKLQLSVQNGQTTEAWLGQLDAREMALLEEVARGPQWLAYGYFNAKIAAMQLTDSPLKDLVSVFDDYQKMIRSLRPIDYAPKGTVSPLQSSLQSPDQDDLRDFYNTTRGRDDLNVNAGAPLSNEEKTIESALF